MAVHETLSTILPGEKEEKAVFRHSSCTQLFLLRALMHQERQTGLKAARQLTLRASTTAELSTVSLKCYEVQRWQKDGEKKGEARYWRKKDMHQLLFEYTLLSSLLQHQLATHRAPNPSAIPLEG